MYPFTLEVLKLNGNGKKGKTADQGVASTCLQCVAVMNMSSMLVKLNRSIHDTGRTAIGGSNTRV